MKFCSKTAFLFAALLPLKIFSAEIITSNTTASTIINVPKTQQKIRIDGHINESVWKNALKINLNNVTRPYENTLAPVKTEAYVIENGNVLYVAFKAFDPKPLVCISHNQHKIILQTTRFHNKY